MLIISIEEALEIISYNPFWETLKNSPETTYTLINKYHISSAIIDKPRKKYNNN
jgi:predicted transcriptional regulator